MNSTKKNKLTDSNGINIANKNLFYCELTALYWIWKNSKEDIVGLEHYRRYFSNKYNILLSEIEILDILYSNDIILTQFIIYIIEKIQVLINGGYNFGMVKELNKTLYIIKLIYPEYYQTCIEYLDSNKLYCCNMFITKKEICNKWCKFIFNILELYEKSEGINLFKNKRICGYIGEFLLGAWVLKNKLKIYESRKITFNKNLSKIL